MCYGSFSCFSFLYFRAELNFFVGLHFQANWPDIPAWGPGIQVQQVMSAHGRQHCVSILVSRQVVLSFIV